MDVHVTGAGAVAQVAVADPEQLQQEECRQVLDAVHAHVRLHPWAASGAPREWTFWLESDGTPFADEHQVYRQACAWPALHGQVHSLVQATAAGPRRRPWADEETPTGAAGAAYLAMADLRWLPGYLEYLASCDLDHEVHQAAEMDGIIASHGWGPDTLGLAAARAWRLGGQHGEEQFDSWVEEGGLGDYLGSPDGAAAFRAAARAELELDGPLDPRPGQDQARARRRFEQHVDGGLEYFARYLDEDELGRIRGAAMARWDRLAAS